MSSRTDVQTPPGLYNLLHSQCDFDHDPCPIGGTGGLDREVPWGCRNFVNPPFDNIEPWLERAVEEWQQRGNSSMLLVPMRPHTSYWRRLVMPNVNAFYLLFDRVKFVGYDRPFPLPLALLVFGAFPLVQGSDEYPLKCYRLVE